MHGERTQGAGLAHYTEVTRLDPSREIAWKHLGYRRQGNRWVKPEEAAAEKLEAEHQKRRHSLEAAAGETAARAGKRLVGAARQGTRGLAEETDPRAVPMVWKVFGNGNERMQLVAVQLLSQIEGPSASFWLAVLAVDSPSEKVRRRATQALTGRDPRDVIGRLINLVRRPYKYEVKPGIGPGSTAALIVDGERFDVQRFYRFPDIDVRLMPVFVRPPRQTDVRSQNIALTPNNATQFWAEMRLNQLIRDYVAAQRQMMAMAAVEEAKRENVAMQQTLENDIRMLDQTNAQINQTNGRVLPVLQALTGKSFGEDPEPWKKWWTDKLGYVYQSSSSATKPVLTQTVGMPDVTINLPVPVVHSSCFAAGTLVQTLDGPRSIESIQIGDRVLSQHTTSGELAFEPVVATHKNEPSPTLRLKLGDETIVATGIHRFWKAGKGWTMARDLKAGDRISVVGGVTEIQLIEADADTAGVQSRRCR